MGGTEVVLGRGSAQSSKLYLRLTGSQYGEQMPKDGTIADAEIVTIKNWIDQGAEWPDEASGDPPASPNGGIDAADGRGAARRRRERCAGCSPPGANPNAANDAGATALMWGVTSLAVTTGTGRCRARTSTRKSADARTPLLIACGVPGARPVAQLLLERGARLDARAPWLGEQVSCLSEAARIGDAALVRQVMPREREARHDSRRSAFRSPWRFARSARNALTSSRRDTPPQLLSAVMAASRARLVATRRRRCHCSPAARTRRPTHPFVPGVSMLMVAAASDAATPEVIRALLDRGVDPNAVGPGGMTALAIAEKRGPTPIVDLLLKAGAKDTPEAAPAPPASRAGGLAARRDRPQPAAAAARRRGVPPQDRLRLVPQQLAYGDDGVARAGSAASGSTSRSHGPSCARRPNTSTTGAERTLQNHGIPGDVDSVGYMLMGLAAERHAPDAATDAMARFIRLQQAPNGSWLLLAHRPPIESSEIEVTVSAIRSLQVYAPAWDRTATDASIGRAVAWLKTRHATVKRRLRVSVARVRVDEG